MFRLTREKQVLLLFHPKPVAKARSSPHGLRGRHRGFLAGLLWFAPQLMKTLSVVGTVAMFLVGGGILLHASHDVSEAVESLAGQLPLAGGLVSGFLGGLAGLAAGAILVKGYDALAALRKTEA